VDPSDVRAICSAIPFKYIQRLIDAFSDLLESCPHLEFILLWSQVTFSLSFPPSLLKLMFWLISSLSIFFLSQELCKVHGNYIQQNSRTLLPSLKSLQKSITRLHQDLADTCPSNEYLLKYLCSAGTKK
jgi:periodic tryptophan protein 2